MPEPAVPEPVVAAAIDIWRDTNEQHWVTTAGHSMEPVIQQGDRALVQFGMAGVTAGSVIVFARDGALVAHRVLRILESPPPSNTSKNVQINMRRYMTKGDNTLAFDNTINEDDVLGRVLAVERNGNQISLDTALWHISGRLIAGASVAAAGIFSSTRRLKQRALGSSPILSEKLPQRCARAATVTVLKMASLFSGRER